MCGKTQWAVPVDMLGVHAKFAHGLRGPFRSDIGTPDALGSFGLKNLPSHSAFACAMQRRRPVGLNPTLLEGSPRNAAGEYAACMGLEEDVDAQAAMRADGLAWKEHLRFPEVHVGLARCLPCSWPGIREGTACRVGATADGARLAGRAAVLLRQAGGPLSAQAALVRGNKLFCSTSVGKLWVFL